GRGRCGADLRDPRARDRADLLRSRGRDPAALAHLRATGDRHRRGAVQYAPDGQGVRRTDVRAGAAASRRRGSLSCYNLTMPRKSVAQARCALCNAKDVSEPRGEEKYCRDCWDKKIAVEEIVAREFALKRYIRAHSAEKYLIYHSTLKRPCGQLIVVDDGYGLFLTLMLYPNFGWDEPAYHLDGDPEGRTFAEILVDVVAAEVIEPWGGGKWHLEVFRSTNPEPEDWNGEM